MHLLCWNIRNPWNAHPEKEWHCPGSVIGLTLPRHREHVPGMQQGFLHPPQELPLHFPWCLPPHAPQKTPPSKAACGAAPVSRRANPITQSMKCFSLFSHSQWMDTWYLMHCTPSIVIQGHFCLVSRLFCLEWMDAL